MSPRTFLFLSVAIPVGLLAEPVSDLLPPQKRAETLALARSLLATKSADLSEEALASMNPFNPLPPVIQGGGAEQPSAQVVVPVAVSDRFLLERMAEGLTPSGMMQLGDRTILLLGNKKLKVGDPIFVESDGATHELKVSAITRTSFTVRLRNEEITRPIKALVKKP